MTRKFELTIGTDPEFFVCESKDGQSVSDPIIACGKFGGGKGSPILLTDTGGYLEDGVTVEFNLVPEKSLAAMQKKVFALLSEFEKQKNVKISYHSSCTFNLTELKKHPEAMAIGCAPDRYAYGLRSAPSVAQFKNRRFAGGHIHIGIDPWPKGLEKATLVKFLDVNVLLPFFGVYHDPDRYRHYGYPGLYRETSYGVEWRSPDNSWCNPRVWENRRTDQKRYLEAFMERFDGEMQVVMDVLNKDGDGVRLNETIESYIKVHNLADLFSSQNNRKKNAFGSSARGHYSKLSAHVRELMSDRSKKSKKTFDVVMDEFALDAGTEA